MDLNEGDDDDFFGSQSAGEDGNTSQRHAEIRNFANPQQPAGIVNALDTLALYEERAEEQKLRYACRSRKSGCAFFTVALFEKLLKALLIYYSTQNLQVP
jgi:hypothetical protein